MTAMSPTVTVINAVRPGAARNSRVAWYMTPMLVDRGRRRIARAMGLRGRLSVDPGRWRTRARGFSTGGGPLTLGP